ncbi:hypothetical protein [Belnapia moabensis]|uniref:hypothetical protein n=1 Tax=Belnapia moabensis TaxID=365533 RepID=UPI001FDEE8BB|nr:hypothetical protein [Belnapia moabensis]
MLERQEPLDGLSLLTFGPGAFGQLRQFQLELTDALNGSMPQGPWSLGESPAEFVDTVTDLCASYVGPPVENVNRPVDLSRYNTRDVAGGLASAASVLALLDGTDIGIQYFSPLTALSGRPLGLADFLSHMSVAEMAWLRNRQHGKASVLSHRLHDFAGPVQYRISTLTGLPMGPSGWRMASAAMRGRYAQTKNSLQHNLKQCNGMEATPIQVAEELLNILELENTISHTRFGYSNKGDREDALRRCSSRLEESLTDLKTSTSGRLSSREEFDALRAKLGERLAIIHYLQGRKRRTILAALARVASLGANASETRALATNDEAFVRNL